MASFTRSGRSAREFFPILNGSKRSILLKNSVLRRSENSMEFFRRLVRKSQTNSAVLSCVRSDFHATSATPLVTTIRNAAYIANEIAAHFKTEFFNRIGT